MVNAEHLYKMVILEQAKNQRNIGTLSGDNVINTRARNNSCGDDLELFVRINNHQIEEVKYKIQGCILSKAAVSILAEQVLDKDLAEVRKILTEFSTMMQGRKTNESYLAKELTILHEVVKFPVRIKCVMLPFKALEKIIMEVE